MSEVSRMRDEGLITSCKLSTKDPIPLMWNEDFAVS